MIKNFYTRDERAFRALANCGHVTIEDIKKDGLRDKRINDYIKNDYVTLEKNRDEQALKLTKKGKEVAKKLYGIDSFQQATSIAHDSKLSAIYHQLDDDERKDWVNETQLKRELEEDLKNQKFGSTCFDDEKMTREELRANLSVADAKIGGVFIEIITENYTSDDIEAKENYASFYDNEIEFYK